MSDWNWRLTLPLVVLYIIGIAGFWAPLYVPPLAALIKDGVNADWLGFAGNIVGAAGTLVAAAVAWLAVQHQLKAQAASAEGARKTKEFSARATLPLSLSALHQYATRCISTIERLPDHPAAGTTMDIPPLPLDDVNTIREALEHMKREPAKQLAITLKFLQIQRARLQELEEEVFDGAVSSFVRQRRLIDAVDLVGLIDRSFTYARGEDFAAPKLNVDEFDSAFRKYTNSEVAEYPIIENELKYRATQAESVSTS